MLRNFLELKERKNIDIDGKDRIKVHRDIIQSKPIMLEVFTEMHDIFYKLDKKFFNTEGKRIELGAGAYPIKETYQNVISSDVVEGHDIDLVLDAMNMNIEPNSVRSLYAQNVFHHFPDPRKFFSEANKVLAVGGGIIILDPFYGLVSSLIYPHISPNESFHKNQKNWEGSHTGPMKGANQALSYIIFNRDKKIFEKEFPDLKIVHHSIVNNYLRYFLSGGLNFKQLIPNFMNKPFRLLEFLLTPFSRIFALHHVIVVKKCK